MPDTLHTQLDRWRIIVANSCASEVLVLNGQDGFTLPEVRVSANQRVAWNLNAELKRNWNLDVVSITPVELESASTIDGLVQYHVAELLCADAPLPNGMGLRSVSSLTPELFANASDAEALRTFCDGLSISTSKAAPFRQVGWFGEVAAWTQEVLAPFALKWNGRFEQFHASASFSLIRFETKPRPVWFKAAGDPNTREFRITQELAKRCPDGVPRLLAVRPEWNAWLAEECPGRTLDEIVAIELWCKASRTLAELQIASLEGAGDLRRAGAHNLRETFSLPVIEHFFLAAETLASPNSDAKDIGVSPEELPEMKADLLALRARMENSSLPDALGHLDLNAGNAVVSSERCVYRVFSGGPRGVGRHTAARGLCLRATLLQRCRDRRARQFQIHRLSARASTKNET
jgi:hypothetical protein